MVTLSFEKLSKNFPRDIMEKSANYSYKIKSGYVFDIQVRNVCWLQRISSYRLKLIKNVKNKVYTKYFSNENEK